MTQVLDTPAPEAIGPVPAEERITVIDCLRGAALFGILTANMRGFNAPLSAYMQPSLMWTWLPDRLAQALVGDDSGGAATLRLEREEAVPRTDVQYR